MREIESDPPAVNASAAESPSTSTFPRLLAASIGIFTFLAYLPTLRFQFVHDDRGQIVGNPAMHTWHAVPGYFASHVWAGVGPAYLGNESRPVFLLWLRINDAIFGHQEAGWHFTTVLAPTAPSYHFALGMDLKLKGYWSGALAQFTKELELNPGHQAAAQLAAEIQKQIVRK
ncbi:MAG: hypothetical protein ABSG32_01155 [Terriglobia bacterium]|jgi:hypothetical protein